MVEQIEHADSFTAIAEPTEDGHFSAYIPDVPGCIASAPTLSEVRELLAAALAAHLEQIRANHELVPVSHSSAFNVEPRGQG